MRYKRYVSNCEIYQNIWEVLVGWGGGGGDGGQSGKMECKVRGEQFSDRILSCFSFPLEAKK